MYVCICHAVSESKVQDSIEAGARSIEEVTQGCRAGGDCGSCHQHIEMMIEDHEDEQRPHRLPVLCPGASHAA